MIDTATHMSKYTADWAWPPFFTLAAVIGSLAAGCMMPFVAIAVIAAGTLDMQRGLIAVIATWAANQIIGFGMLGYPLDAPTIASGAALCASALIAFAVARRTLTGPFPVLAGFGLAGLFSFAAYEAALYAMAHIYGAADMFSAEIITLIGVNEALWLVGFVLAHQLLTRSLPRQFGKPTPLIRA